MTLKRKLFQKDEKNNKHVVNMLITNFCSYPEIQDFKIFLIPINPQKLNMFNLFL